jgi:hypothetical protein
MKPESTRYYPEQLECAPKHVRWMLASILSSTRNMHLRLVRSLQARLARCGARMTA